MLLRVPLQPQRKDNHHGHERGLSLFIHEVFPQDEIIIDCFHIVQLLGRALDQARIATLIQIQNHPLRTYKLLKLQ
ncbi:transposase [Lacticaseibacillus jixianensis]|uniref:transposase n=1 Tax=Lacticaseibacillus jixianensis TaxID=2486012 RepID=UPI0036402DD6